ncbi:MAG: hypothetical protein ACOYMG_25755, partial [Candidatus Methylumidiphilus sp.]
MSVNAHAKFAVNWIIPTSFIALCLCVCVLSKPVLAGPIDEIVGKISQTEYASYVQDLQNFGTRFYNTQGN